MASYLCLMRRVLVVALSCAAFAPAGAQIMTASLVGVVRDSGGIPIPGVEVRFTGGDIISVRTNDSGGFRMVNLPTGIASVTLRRMGFLPATAEVRIRAGRTDSLVF